MNKNNSGLVPRFSKFAWGPLNVEILGDPCGRAQFQMRF